ncbi:MAG: tRNA pseudouridine(38-40) synthase TruA [bacterium]
MQCPEVVERTLKLTVEYEGTHFSGWQTQPNRRTVQREIEDALCELTKEKIGIVGAGRTDAGVHAFGQVASFTTASRLPLAAFKEGLNGHLPEDVRITHARQVKASFNARRDALSRTYRYVLSKRSRVIGCQYSWHPRMDFSAESIGRIERASKSLLGQHDFTSFSKADGQGDEFLSEIFDVNWRQIDDEIRFEITAKRFFHHMIRIIMGTLFYVGVGKLTPESFQEILESRDRRRAGPTAPARGLFLMKVDYGEDV